MPLTEEERKRLAKKFSKEHKPASGAMEPTFDETFWKVLQSMGRGFGVSSSGMKPSVSRYTGGPDLENGIQYPLEPAGSTPMPPARKATFPDGGSLPNTKATKADSIAVRNNALSIENYYKNKKYKETDRYGFTKFGEQKDLEDFNYENDLYGIKTETGTRKLRPSQYYINLDKNKFFIRERASSILDLRAPMGLYDRRIKPQEIVTYGNVDPKDPLSGDVSLVYKYDPLAVTPWDMLNESQRKERIRKYGTSGVPKSATSTAVTTKRDNSPSQPKPDPRNVRPDITALQSKQLPEDFDTIGIRGNIEQMPSTAPMEIPPEGHYRVTRTHTYGDPNYQVWTPGDKWKDVSKEEYDRIAGEKYLTEYKYGGDMRKRKLKLTNGGAPFASTLPTEWATDDLGKIGGSIAGSADNSWAPNMKQPGVTDQVLNTASSTAGVPGLAQAVKLGDQVTGMAIDAGQDYLTPRLGLMDQGEENIAYKYSNKLDSIPLIGKQLGTAIDAVRVGTGRVADDVKDYRLNRRKSASSDFTGAAKSFVMAKGGKLPFTEYEGLTHDEMDPMTGETGVQFDPHPDPNMPDVEVEAGETSFDGKVFTDREEYKKGVTFARESKKYNKELEMRPTDKISKDVAKKKLDRLFEIQEARKAAAMDKYSVMKADAMSSPYGEKIMAKYGGKLKMAAGGDPISVDNIMELSGINENALDLAQMGQLAAPVMQGIQAARDKDVLKFDRIQIPRLDTKTPVDMLRQQSKEQVATAASNIARNAGNQGQYLAARGALGARAASDLGRNVALMKSDLANKQAAMDFEGNKANTSISNSEREYAQNRKDFLRKQALQATDAFGSRSAGIAKDDAAFKADLFEEVTKANALGGEEFMYVFDPNDRKMKYIRRPK